MHIRFIQKIIDKIRNKEEKETKEFLKICESNDIHINEKVRKNIKLNIEGKNNKIIINTDFIYGTLNIDIFGDNNYIFFDEGVIVVKNLSVLLGVNYKYFDKVYNSSFEINKNTSIEQMNYITYNSNAYCKVEEDCIFACGITLFNTDAHPIFKKGTKEIINKVKGIKIGRHSWIGRNVTILKNSQIPENSILGANTVYTGAHTKTYCAFAGNPAKIIKEDVEWEINGAKFGYISNEI
jgi:acetyltransferase-like isoleucine patch superfamily enzyme